LWFPPERIPLEDGTTALLPVLMVSAHLRFICAAMVPSRHTEELLLAPWSLIERLGRVPRRLIWDNETGIGRGGRLAVGVAEFCGTLATRVHQLMARDPESIRSSGASQRVLRNVVHAGPTVRLASGLQHPIRRLARGEGQ